MTRAPSASAIAIDRARRLRFCRSLRTIFGGFSSMSSPASTAEAAEPALDQQHREEHEQIKDRKSEKMVRRAVGACTFTLVAYAPSERNHEKPDYQRGDSIDRVGIAEQPRREADRHQRDGVKQDLPSRLRCSGNDRKHRDTGAGIVFGARKR